MSIEIISFTADQRTKKAYFTYFQGVIVSINPPVRLSIIVCVKPASYGWSKNSIARINLPVKQTQDQKYLNGNIL